MFLTGPRPKSGQVHPPGTNYGTCLKNRTTDKHNEQLSQLKLELEPFEASLFLIS